MISRLQAKIPVESGGKTVHRWIQKIFPWNRDGLKDSSRFQDRRDFFRLKVEEGDAIEAALWLKDGTVVNMALIDLSASGLCGRIQEPMEISEGEVVTALFILPLPEPVILKMESTLISQGARALPKSTVLHLKFTDRMDEKNREFIHRYIIKTQFDQLKGSETVEEEE